MIIEEVSMELKVSQLETLDSYIQKEDNYSISHNAMFSGFRHRSKVEFLRFFIV